VWDASDAVLPDAAADAARPLPALADADAGKSAARARVCLESDVPFLQMGCCLTLQVAQVEAEALCKPDAGPSAEQSSSARESQGLRAEPAVQALAEQSSPLVERRR